MAIREPTPYIGFNLNRSIDVLRRTPPILREMFHDADDTWTHSNYGQDTWSPFDILGHFVHGEKSDWMTRLRVILEHGEQKTFQPFDRYAQYEDSRGKTMNDLLDEFAALRAKNIDALIGLNLSEQDFTRQGTHPEFGTVTLGQLLATWTVHDLHHIAQCAKAMAHQLHRDVGPWRAYLGIVQARHQNK